MLEKIVDQRRGNQRKRRSKSAFFRIISINQIESEIIFQNKRIRIFFKLFLIRKKKKKVKKKKKIFLCFRYHFFLDFVFRKDFFARIIYFQLYFIIIF